jgi:hypothetical protein
MAEASSFPIKEADAMHALLVRHATYLVGCIDNSPEQAELILLNDAVESFETHRRPLGVGLHWTESDALHTALVRCAELHRADPDFVQQVVAFDEAAKAYEVANDESRYLIPKTWFSD